ncbi:TPA: hypothetical protein PW556_002195, partial [Mannheimia haemolytica]|nr:hypothetical protein [Mannheimia haemolytica]
DVRQLGLNKVADDYVKAGLMKAVDPDRHIYGLTEQGAYIANSVANIVEKEKANNQPKKKGKSIPALPAGLTPVKIVNEEQVSSWGISTNSNPSASGSNYVKSEATIKKSNATYLNVPYAEKDGAKALGAKWDKFKKKWYLPAGKEMPEGLKKYATDGFSISERLDILLQRMKQ